MQSRAIASFLGCLLLILVAALVYWIPDGNSRSTIASSLPNTQQIAGEKHVATGTHGTNATVILPFVGAVPCRMHSEAIEATVRGRAPRAMDFQIFEDEAGRFLRASFFQEGARNFEKSPDEQAAGMSVSSEKILGLAKEEPKVSWQEVVKIVAQQVPMEKVTQLSIAYVEYSIPQEQAPMFLIHVMGAATPSEKLPNTPENLRVRFLAHSNGELLRFDNNL